MPAKRSSRTSKRLPTVAPAAEAQRPPTDGTRWLLLIHQIPPKPDYLRVKIGRRLQRVGAVAIKNSVYVLPPSPESYEDFRWIVREIEDAGGEAFVSEASLDEGLSDESVRARFDTARNEEYRELSVAASALLKTTKRAEPAPVERELAKLRRRYESVRALDFFTASDGSVVASLLADIDQQLRRRESRAHEPGARRSFYGATWVTRRDVHVDRIASAWLIRRFIDRRAQLRFVDATRHAHHEGELRFDMFEGEYTHVGDACTFEGLVNAFVQRDDALREIAEIVHDVDCKDGKFGRDEAPGLARMIAGIVALGARDEDRVERGARLFDELYAAFGGLPQ
jgi:hypothetical protein